MSQDHNSRDFRITVEGDKELRRALEDTAGSLSKLAQEILQPPAEQTRDKVKQVIEDAPRVDRGVLLEGIRAINRSSRGRAEFVIRPTAAPDRYAIFVEEDTRPHWAPRAALQGWADRHNIPVYAVLWKIAREGTTGIHMFQIAWEELRGQGEAVANKIGQRIIIQLSR